ncbi:hypothetical protein SDC9_196402 [bioreactor metagenome]|uniref:Uncharacterized protein n=1 Tax=bioreactor metagenome TaxID=1076179 RepID=A0A645ICD8_9ZZZZ
MPRYLFDLKQQFLQGSAKFFSVGGNLNTCQNDFPKTLVF